LGTANEARWRTVKAAIEQRRAEIPLAEARRDIVAALDLEKSATVSEKAIRQIRAVLKRGSAWTEAKKLGKAFIPSGTQLTAYEQLADSFRRIGLYIVEVGELEGFCRTVPGHGPSWVSDVLQRDLRGDRELAPAREFARAIGTAWPNGLSSPAEQQT
jgi:hypothetical protein